MFKLLIFQAVFLFLTASESTDPTAEADAFWEEISRTVADGDFEGYAALYHEDAVLVNGISGQSYPISDALDGWQQGFEDTKAGKMNANVEFRFSERIHGETTVHDTGIFRYASQAVGENEESAYIHFQGLLIKIGDDWKMIMEFQISEASEQEWNYLTGD